MGLEPAQSDPCLYTGTFLGQEIHLVVYIDDGLAISKDMDILKASIDAIGKIIKIRIVDSNIFVGFEIEQDDNSIRVHQRSYILKLLDTFNMSDCSPISTPINDTKDLASRSDEDERSNAPYRQLIGSLNYCSSICRPDIAYSVSTLSRYM